MREQKLNLEEILHRALAAYDTAAARFIEKVDTGQARSTETYKDLKACQRISARARLGLGPEG